MNGVRQASKAARRAEILEAAASLFARHGFDGTSIADIAAAMGKPKSAVGYAQFTTKQEIADAVIAEQIDHWTTVRGFAEEAPSGFVRLFVALVLALRDAQARPRGLAAARLIMGRMVERGPQPEGTWHAWMREQVQVEVALGRCGPGTDPGEVTDNVLAASWGLFEAGTTGFCVAVTEQRMVDLWTVVLLGSGVRDAGDILRLARDVADSATATAS